MVKSNHLGQLDSLVYCVVLNDSSPCRDIYKLKYEYSLPEFWRLKLSLEAQAKMKNASYLDDKSERDNQPKR